MKKGYGLLIVGPALIISAVALAACTFAVIQSNTFLFSHLTEDKNDVLIKPDSLYPQIVGARSGERFNVTVTHEPVGSLLVTQVRDPEGRIALQLEHNQTNGQFVAASQGIYTLVVRNFGSEGVNATLSIDRLGIDTKYSSWTAQLPSYLVAYGLQTSGILFLAGIICLIIGAIKSAKERKGTDNQRSSVKQLFKVVGIALGGAVVSLYFFGYPVAGIVYVIIILIFYFLRKRKRRKDGFSSGESAMKS